jgi:hypothetical protein
MSLLIKLNTEFGAGYERDVLDEKLNRLAAERLPVCFEMDATDCTGRHSDRES